MVMADVTDEMVEQGAEAAYENWRAGYVDATPFPGKPPSPWSELDNAKRFPTLENTRAALSTVAPLIAAQARREALEEAAAYEDRVADEFERFASTCEPSDENTRVELNNVASSHRSAANVIRLLANKPKETSDAD